MLARLTSRALGARTALAAPLSTLVRHPGVTYYEATAGPATSYAAAGAGAGGGKDVRVNVAVVGGGYAGLSTALGLVERGVNGVTLLEAKTIGYGASGRNGGFCFGGYSVGEETLRGLLGSELSYRLYHRTLDAVKLVRKRIKDNNLDCDITEDGVVWASWFKDTKGLEERVLELAQHYDTHWELLSKQQLKHIVNSDRYHGGAWEHDSFHVHPLKWVRGLASIAAKAGVTIHENSPVADLSRRAGGPTDGGRWTLRTANGTNIHADIVVLCCGGYLANLKNQIDRSILPIATYVMATEPLGEERMKTLFPGPRPAVYDSRFAFDYYRPLKDTRILWGGRISILDRTPEGVAKLLRKDMLKVFPSLHDVQIDHAWSGLMSYAKHEMPQVGRLDDGHLWYAQAFGGHGLATTVAAGEVLAAGIAHGEEGWRDYSAFGLDWAGKPAGFLAAQATYSYYQARDALKDALEFKSK